MKLYFNLISNCLPFQRKNNEFAPNKPKLHLKFPPGVI